MATQLNRVYVQTIDSTATTDPTLLLGTKPVTTSVQVGGLGTGSNQLLFNSTGINVSGPLNASRMTLQNASITTLGVTGETTLQNVSINGTLRVNGQITINNVSATTLSISTLSVANNANVSGNVTIAGSLLGLSSLTLPTLTTTTNTVMANASVLGTLKVAQETTLQNASINGTLRVDGSTTVNGATTFNNSVTMNNNPLTFNGTNGKLTVATGDTSLQNTSVQGLTATNTWLGKTLITGQTDINTTGSLTTTIGNSLTTMNVSGTVNINTGGTGITRIGATGNTVTLLGTVTAPTPTTSDTSVATTAYVNGQSFAKNGANANTYSLLQTMSGGISVTGATGINTLGSETTTIGGSSSATTVGGTLGVTGKSTLGLVDIIGITNINGVGSTNTGTITIGNSTTGGTTTLASPTVNINNAGTGTTTIGSGTSGTLVSGNCSMSRTLAVVGNCSFNNVSMTGAVNINTGGSAVTTIGSGSSATSVGGTLTVTGRSSLANASLTGAFDINTTGTEMTRIGNSATTTNVSGTVNLTAVTNINTTGISTTTIGSGTSGNIVEVVNGLTDHTGMGTDIKGSIIIGFGGPSITADGATRTISNWVGNYSGAQFNTQVRLVKKQTYKVVITLRALTDDTKVWFAEVGPNTMLLDLGLIQKTDFKTFTGYFSSSIENVIAIWHGFTGSDTNTASRQVEIKFLSITPVYQTKMNGGVDMDGPLIMNGPVTLEKIASRTLSSHIDIVPDQTSGILSLGTNSARTGDINIGNNMTSGVIRIGSNYTTTTPVIEIGTSNKGTMIVRGTTIRICDNGGNVGIGTTTPSYPLHITSINQISSTSNGIAAGLTGIGLINSITSSGSTAIRYFYPSQDVTSTVTSIAGVLSNNWANIVYISLVTLGSILTGGGFMIMSDRRIKSNIVDVEDDRALRDLRLLKPKTYTYNDVVTRGSEPVYGFIAQEVKEVLNYASSVITEVIPNVYELAAFSTDTLTLTSNTSDLSRDASGVLFSKLKLTTREGKDEFVNIVEILDDHRVKVDKDLTEWGGQIDASGQLVPGNKIFVYGQEVNDFHTLNKDAIWTVATAALQEVDRQLQAEKQKVSALQTALDALLARVESLEQKTST